MKAKLFLMAMAGVALAGCVSEEVADVKQKEQEKVKIAFDAPVLYNNSESRANVFGEMPSTYSRSESFQIYATKYDAGTGYDGWKTTTGQDGYVKFNDTSVGYITNLQGWAPLDDDKYYYWEDGKEMAFAACSPANLGVTGVNRTYAGDGLTIENFEINGNASEQYDLLFSERVYDADASDMNHLPGAYSGISIAFQHALSSIHFSIENETLAAASENDRVNITLNSISIYGVKYKGTFKENLTEKTDNEYNEQYVRTDLSDNNTTGNVNPTWNVNDDKITSPYTAFVPNETNKLEFPQESAHVAEYINEMGQLDSKDYGDAYPLLLMPQQLEEDAYIEVKYYIGDSQNVTTKSIKLNTLKSGSTPITEWKIGHRYVYNLKYTLASAKADKIIFAPSVGNWVNVNVIDVEIK